MKKKLLIAAILVLTLGVLLLTGCGNDNDADGDGPVRFVIGATPVPHTEILEFIQPKMLAEGIDMQIRTFTDFVQPNHSTQAGDLDANYFQHRPFMDNFNSANGTDMVAVFPVHFEPLALYRSRTENLEDLGSGSIIAIPNDPTNGARALNLLEAAGLITLRDGAGVLATRLDIVDNPLGLDIRELEAAQIPHILPDVDMAVINGNFALQAGLEIGTDSVAQEDKDSISAQTYANYIVVRAGNEDDFRVQTLIRILASDEVREFIESRYEGRVVPVF